VTNSLNSAIAPAQLKGDLTTDYRHTISKSTDYFEWLYESQNEDSKAFVSKVKSVKRLRTQVI
jgi:hypothetical protein